MTPANSETMVVQSQDMAEAATGQPRAVDVILSTFNGSKFLRNAIESVLDQSFQHFNFYIIDDCSSDDSWKIIETYRDDRILKSLNDRNRGLFHNINSILKRSSSPLIKLLGQDDVLESDCLARGSEFHIQHPEVGYFWTYCKYMDEAGDIINVDDMSHVSGPLDRCDAVLASLKWGCLSANISSVFLSREGLIAAGPFREDIMSADFDMMARIQNTHLLARIVEPLTRIRSHGGQWSGNLLAMENHVAGNCEVFAKLMALAGRPELSIDPESARRAVIERLSRCELDWTIKALAGTGQAAAFARSVRRIGRLAPLTTVTARWAAKRVARMQGKVLAE